MLNHLFMKIVTHIFGYEICSMPNIFGFKIFDESILLGVIIEPSICTPPLLQGNNPEGFQNEHLIN